MDRSTDLARMGTMRGRLYRASPAIEKEASEDKAEG